MAKESGQPLRKVSWPEVRLVLTCVVVVTEERAVCRKSVAGDTMGGQGARA